MFNPDTESSQLPPLFCIILQCDNPGAILKMLREDFNLKYEVVESLLFVLDELIVSVCASTRSTLFAINNKTVFLE